MPDIKTVVNYITNTKTKSGLVADCQADYNQYEKSIKITDEQIETVDIERVGPYEDYAYIIRGFKECKQLSDSVFLLSSVIESKAGPAGDFFHVFVGKFDYDRIFDFFLGLLLLRIVHVLFLPFFLSDIIPLFVCDYKRAGAYILLYEVLQRGGW